MEPKHIWIVAVSAVITFVAFQAGYNTGYEQGKQDAARFVVYEREDGSLNKFEADDE